MEQTPNFQHPQIDEQEFGEGETRPLASRQACETALDMSELGLWKLSLVRREIACSTRCKAHLGFAPESNPSLTLFAERLGTTDEGDGKPMIDAGVLVRTMAEEVKKNGAYRAQCQVTWPDGSTHWIELRGRALRDATDAAGSMIGITRDLTPAQEAAQRQEKLLSTIRHELKTPLTTIKGFAQLLRRQMKKQGLEEQAEMLTRIEQQVNVLTSLINELKESGTIQTQEQKQAAEASTGCMFPQTQEEAALDASPPLPSLSEGFFLSGESSSDYGPARSDR